ncbi:hypothetical protein JCM19232_2941 [Vibrio ishigakensis]|uniref:Uncharacterized protein n=1 Tax=Vibrio ishigakensis TaxID=1481914 RepID=A0A0B8PIF1_9VIBR|nr:hypothetical protein JCM19232_2941 [Vibrio ishigakensis]
MENTYNGKDLVDTTGGTVRHLSSCAADIIANSVTLSPDIVIIDE